MVHNDIYNPESWNDWADFEGSVEFQRVIETLKVSHQHKPTDFTKPTTKEITVGNNLDNIVEIRVGQTGFVKKQNQHQTVNLVFDIEMADKPTTTKQVSSELAIILDISGSMAGEPLERSKMAITQTIDSLGKEDMLHFITYSTIAEIQFAGYMTEKNKFDLKCRLLEIETKGTTNMVDGIVSAIQSMFCGENVNSNNNKRLFLFTDGQVNCGVKESTEIVSVVESVHKNFGVNTTAFGFGSSYNEELMRNIAAKGLGDYFFINGVDDLSFKVAKGLSVLQSLYAINAKLNIIASQSKQCAVEITKVCGYQENASSIAQAKLGDLCFDDLRQIVCKLNIYISDIEYKEALSMLQYSLTYEEIDPEDGSISIREKKGDISVLITEDQTLLAAMPNALRVALAIQDVNSNDKAVLSLVKQRDYEPAKDLQRQTLDLLDSIMEIDTTGIVVHLISAAEKLLVKLEAEEEESIEMECGYNEYRVSIVHRKCF